MSEGACALNSDVYALPTHRTRQVGRVPGKRNAPLHEGISDTPVKVELAFPEGRVAGSPEEVGSGLLDAGLERRGMFRPPGHDDPPVVVPDPEARSDSAAPGNARGHDGSVLFEREVGESGVHPVG
jgi:hypothetical protein